MLYQDVFSQIGVHTILKKNVADSWQQQNPWKIYLDKLVFEYLWKNYFTGIFQAFREVFLIIAILQNSSQMRI